MPELYHIHPFVIHFPIVLLTVGWALEFLAVWRERPEWAGAAATWSLWIGTFLAWAAVGAGLLAEEFAPHVPAAWETLAEHEALGFWTAGLFSGLSLWRWRWSDKGRRLFAGAWLLATAVLLATAYHGGELVFHHGVGVSGH